jgi:hypothetical protein
MTGILRRREETLEVHGHRKKAMRRHNKKEAICKSRRKDSGETNHFDLGLAILNCEKINFFFFLSYSVFSILWQPKLTNICT